MKNIIYNPMLAKLNVIFQENQQKVVVVFDAIKSLSLEATQSLIAEKLMAYKNSIMVTFNKKKIEFTFDKKTLQEHFFLVLAEIQRFI